jgi:acetyl-CoA carboxylase carboxyl transferase subunit beta
MDQLTPPYVRRVKTEGLWTKCENFRAIVWKKDLDANWRICPKCQHHFRLSATERLEVLLDFRLVEHDVALASNDPLKFTGTRP